MRQGRKHHKRETRVGQRMAPSHEDAYKERSKFFY